MLVLGAAAAVHGAPVGAAGAEAVPAAEEAVQHRRLAQLGGLANGLGGILCGIIPTNWLLDAVGAPGWIPGGIATDACTDQLGSAIGGSY